MIKVAKGSQIASIVMMAVPREIRSLPEVQLWTAVIRSALVEADSAKKSLYPDARAFLTSDRLDLVCDMIGINPEWLRKLIDDHAGWKRFS